MLHKCEVVAVGSPEAGPSQVLFWPEAGAAAVPYRKLKLVKSNCLVEVRKGFSFRLAMVELAILVLAETMAIPHFATNFGKRFMPFVTGSTIRA